MSNIATTVCIIGAGPAGLLTYDYLTRHNISTIIFESSCSYGGQCTAFYRTKPVYGIPGLYNTNAGDFIQSIYNQCIDKSNLILNANVDILDINNDLFYFRYNETVYTCKYLVLATGASSMKPVIPNIKGIDDFINDKEFIQFYCSNFEQYKDKKVVIAGGGESAVDYAIELSKLPSNATQSNLDLPKLPNSSSTNSNLELSRLPVTSSTNFTALSKLPSTATQSNLDLPKLPNSSSTNSNLELSKLPSNASINTSEVSRQAAVNYYINNSDTFGNTAVDYNINPSNTVGNTSVNCDVNSSNNVHNTGANLSRTADTAHNNTYTKNSNVVLLHRRNTLRCDKNKLKLLDNVDLKLNQNIIEIRKNLIITDKEEIQTNNIIFCYGFTYNNNFLKQLLNFGLVLDNNLVPVNINSMETSLKSCYAVGDVVKYPMKKKNIISCCFEAERVVRTILNKEGLCNYE